jgi:ABC-type branched-subunit amino acid transport system substrate-binding protein
MLQAATRLAGSENCSLIMGPTHAALCRTIRGFAEAHKIPLFLTAGDEPILPLRGHPVDWTFSVSPTITSQVKRLFARLKSTRAVPVGILSSNDSMGQRAVLWIKGYAQEFQILAGDLQGYSNQDTDIVSQIKILRTSGASTVYVWGRRGVAPMIAASMRKLPGRYAVPCILLEDSLFTAAQSGVTIVAAAPPVLMRDSLPQGHPCSAPLRQFLSAMADDIEYMSIQEILAAAAAWDAVHMAAMAMRRSGSTRGSIQGAMEKAELEYSGVMGLFRPAKRDHCGLVPRSLTPATLTGYGWRAF